MVEADRSFVEEAYQDLQRTRDEILNRYPDATYLRERYGISNAMRVELPRDEVGEEVYQSIIDRVATLKLQ